MKRLGTIGLVLAALILPLSGACGDGDAETEGVVVAVAFRLDEGAPLLSAYVGDPSKDPFELPAGRYYVEALDEDDIALSLGTVDLQNEGAVELPESFGDAGGVANLGQADSLITVAEFLVDIESADLLLLQIVTGGFTLPPFDPEVKLDAELVRELFDLNQRVAAEGEDLLDALSQIEERAEVSLGRSYVRSPGAPPAGAFDELKEEAREFIDFAPGGLERQRRLTVDYAEGSIPSNDPSGTNVFAALPDDFKRVDGEEAHNMQEWLDFLREGRLDGKLPEIHAFYDDFAAVAALTWRLAEGRWYAGEEDQRPFWAHVHDHTNAIRQSRWFDTRNGAWQRYALNLAEEFGEGDPARGRQLLEQRIRSELDRLFPDSPVLRDALTTLWIRYMAQADRSLAVLGTPGPWPTPTREAETFDVTPTATQTQGPTDKERRLIAESYFAQIKTLVEEGNARFAALEADFPGVWDEPGPTQNALREIDSYIEGALLRLDNLSLDVPPEAEPAHNEFRSAAAAQRQMFQDIANEVAGAQSSSDVLGVLLAYAEQMEQVNTDIAVACVALESSAARFDIALDLHCAGQ